MKGYWYPEPDMTLRKSVALVGAIFALAVAIMLLDGLNAPKLTTYTQVSQDSLSLFRERSLASPCTGVFAYYSGTGFRNDIFSLKAAYLGIADNSTGTVLANDLIILPPSAITYQEPVSCVQMAHWAYCLASYYPNVRCEPYVDEDHIGQVCTEYQDGGKFEITL